MTELSIHLDSPVTLHNPSWEEGGGGAVIQGLICTCSPRRVYTVSAAIKHHTLVPKRHRWVITSVIRGS